MRVTLVNMPDHIRTELREAFSMTKERADDVDFIHIFSTDRIHLQREFPRLMKRLIPTGMLWVSWPKKVSGVPTDLTEDVIREIGLNAELVDVKVCAVDDVWSGLKFVYRLQDRT